MQTPEANGHSSDELVIAAIAESISLEPGEIRSEDTLHGNLDIESINLLDVTFRLRRNTGVEFKGSSFNDQLAEEPSEGLIWTTQADTVARVQEMVRLKKEMPKNTDA